MKTIIDTNIKTSTRLPIQNIVSVYKEIKEQGAEVYFIQHQEMVAVSKLSKLIAFMLTVDEKAPIKMIIQGNHAQKLKQRLKEKLEIQPSIVFSR
ncbi:hypothetical protein [Bacillus sp. JJ722]|uniref:hypothetical protein n=1 Tax=Bacillus sp. JJ722 TaxID=3122973 RepID=UPI003000E80C